MKKKLVALLLSASMVFALAGCAEGAAETASEPAAAQSSDDGAADSSAEGTVYKVGLCNYVADASLDQICDNIQSTLDQIGKENNVTFEVEYDNCNADSNVLNQIVANFIADDVDLMIGVATPVAMSMQAATSDIPIVFSAVTDPLSAGLVNTMDAPGANITGTSDYLDTEAVMNLIFAADPSADKIGLLYDVGQDASTTPIADAKAYLDSKGIEYVERTGTSVDEVKLAAEALVSDGVDAVFTPQDNTIMQAELSIYETLANAGIPHYTGADSFALNGAFLGYGVDYANLGVETAYMVKDILVDGKDPASLSVKTFDNGTATVNTETCETLGFNFDEIKETFGPFCTQVNSITTAESFE
ncbi:MAG: ABC transporter substrate-binding protein [Lachnospiraceae bacterium]|nr:ABC transporter substrate-binding protein [Lachnospiraceae bacterium]